LLDLFAGHEESFRLFELEVTAVVIALTKRHHAIFVELDALQIQLNTDDNRLTLRFQNLNLVSGVCTYPMKEHLLVND